MKSPQAPKAIGLSSSCQQCRLWEELTLSTGALITVLLSTATLPPRKGNRSQQMLPSIMNKIKPFH